MHQLNLQKHVIKLLRLYLGTEVRRISDGFNLQQKPTLKEAIASLDKHWSARTNTSVARYKFPQLRQASGETLERFIARTICAARSCDYNMIEPKKVEEALMMQQLIAGVNDPSVRESLLDQPADDLTWDLACNIVHAKE